MKTLFIASISLFAVEVALKGWVLSVLWKWFMVPSFPVLPALEPVPAMGAALVWAWRSWEMPQQ